MSSALSAQLNSKGCNDIQYAVHVKLTPDVLQALLHAQQVGEHVSLRFAEENKTDVWTIGNQQFSCKAAREDKSELVEVVRCSGDPVEGAPCSPLACVYKKLYFPKTSAEAHLGWKQAQAQKKQQEKRVAKLLDASFNDKGGKGVKHTVRHTAPVAARPVAPSRSVPVKPLISQPRVVQQRQPTPPPSLVKEAAEPAPRPAVRTLNPPKPRSLSSSVQKKDAGKVGGANPAKPAAPPQARPGAPARHGVKGTTPSPPQRGPAAPQHHAPKSSHTTTHSGASDILSSGSPDDGQHHTSTIAPDHDELKRTSPHLSHQSRGQEPTPSYKNPYIQPAPRSSYSQPREDPKLSAGSADNRKQDNSPTSFKSGHHGAGDTSSPPSYNDMHDSKPTRPSPAGPYSSKHPSPLPHSAHNNNPRRHSPHMPAAEPTEPARSKDPYTTIRPASQYRQSPAVPHHGGHDTLKPAHTSPASGYHEGTNGSQKPASVEHSSHHSDGHRSRDGRPSSQDSWQGAGQPTHVNPYTIHNKRNAVDSDMPAKKPKRTPSLPHLHRLGDGNAAGDRPPLSPPLSWSEGAQRPDRPPSAARGVPLRPAAERTPASDNTVATVLGKHGRSQSGEDGERQGGSTKRTHNDRADNTALPPTSHTSKPVASSSPSKRPRQDSPPSSVQDGNTAPPKKLVLKIRRPAGSSTPSTGGSSGGLSIAAPHAATPEVSIQNAPTKDRPCHSTEQAQVTSHVAPVEQRKHSGSVGMDQDAEQGQVTSHVAPVEQRKHSGSVGMDQDAEHGQVTSHVAAAAGQRKHSGSVGTDQDAEQGQAASVSQADTRPSSSDSPGKAAMAYTPEQDEDEHEYSEFLSRKLKSMSPIGSFDEYEKAKNRYQQLYSLYYKLRHRSESFLSELNELHSAVHTHGSSERAAEYRERALQLVSRKGDIFDRWQKALGNLKHEINGLKDAAASWRRSAAT